MSNGTLWSTKSGSIKERTQTSGEMGTGYQRNGHRLRPIICRFVACAANQSCRLRQGGVPLGLCIY